MFEASSTARMIAAAIMTATAAFTSFEDPWHDLQDVSRYSLPDCHQLAQVRSGRPGACGRPDAAPRAGEYGGATVGLAVAPLCSCDGHPPA